MQRWTVTPLEKSVYMFWQTTPLLHDTIFVWGQYKTLHLLYSSCRNKGTEHMRAYKVERPFFHNCYSVMVSMLVM